MSRLFGTDGIRGQFGEYPLTEGPVTALGEILGQYLVSSSGSRQVVLGGDTRASTPTLCTWLATGLARFGAQPVVAGTLPTAASAWLTRRFGLGLGVAVSASHNPHPDNGIKLFGPRGYKLSDEEELAVENALLARLAGRFEQPAAAATIPSAASEVAAHAHWGLRYLDGLLETLPGDARLDGLHLVLDVAHGAATPYARQLFESAGARVTLLADRPDGRNINLDCGSTHPGFLATWMRDNGGDLGLAFDGDADRVIAVDAAGAPRDGDALLYLWAMDLQSRGELRSSAVVATSMSNLGLDRALAERRIRLVRCDVGDRAVMQTLRHEGLVLGGEQSGHIVHLGLSTTGDGLLTGLHVASIVARAGRPLAELLAGFERFPQLLRNIRVQRKIPFAQVPRIQAMARAIETELGARGRLVLRYSGTEPLARIMLEGPDLATISALAERLEEEIREQLGAEQAPIATR
jgi:phosphoglucosamine mutase